MAVWEVESESWREGPGEMGADIKGAHHYWLRHRETGAEREFSIEIAADGPGVPRRRVRWVLRKYLDEPDPPPRVKLDRRGNEIQ